MSRINWTAIKQRVANDTLLFALDRRWQQLLLAVCEDFTWTATFKTAGYDYADWDTLQGVVEKGTFDLMGGIMLSDIIGYIDDIETLLQALNDKPCCQTIDNISYDAPGDIPNTGSPIVPGVGDPPTSYGNDTTLTTWTDWNEYVCEAAYYFVAVLSGKLRDLAYLQSLPGPVNAQMLANFLGRIPGLGIMLKSAFEVFTSLIELAWSTLTDLETAADQIDAAADTIACAIVSAANVDAAADAFRDAAQTAVTGLAASAVVQYMLYEQWANIIYTGVAVDADGVNQDLSSSLTPGTHECCAPVYDFDLEWTFDSDADGWTLTQAVWDATHNGSIKMVPTSPQYSYVSFTQANFLTLTGLPSGTEIDIETLEMDCYLENVVAGGAPNFLLEAYTSPSVTQISDNYNNWTKGVELTNVTATAATPSTKVITTAGGSFLMVHLQHKGTPVPTSYVTRIRLRGYVVA